MFIIAIHARFKCIFQTMLQVFSLNFVKVDLDVAYTYMLQAYICVLGVFIRIL
jgi:hypothetical protein